MHITILTFDGFNELDSLIALGVLNRVKKPDWQVTIASPTQKVCSMNGVIIERHIGIDEVNTADAVIIGSGMKTRDVVADPILIEKLKTQIEPSRQLLAAQCSGALVLAKLGLLNSVPACTDLTTKPWVQEAGIEVLNQAFFAQGDMATAGGCMASQYLAAWIIAKTEGMESAESAIHYIAPVAEQDAYLAMMRKNIKLYI
jgi:transcriptional regulator GlxA family with amidase domain